MVNDREPARGRYRVVPDLPDLIEPEEYPDHPDGRLVRLRITFGPEGVEVLGDAFRPEVLERLLESLGPDDIEQMMCG
ncbi:radical SAM-modified peptide, FtsH ternary system-associated [Kitasatospora sp. NPDC056651]|uniref:radical SAM-modified peptide, FtsH ternary system-associated n=1 Tax=Kitasatospora sp. NPDC056651 TaxID=3345892 RepID=UPI003685D648